MSNLLTAAVTIRGTRPLFQHKFGPEALPLEKQERTGVAGHDPEEWRRTCMVTKEGQLFIRPEYVFSALRDAARYTKKGRGSIQTLVQATLQCTDNRILIDRWLPSFPNGQECDVAVLEAPPTDDDLPVYLDIRGVRNPSTRARNVRYRIAASPGWTCSFHLLWDKTVVPRDQMQAVAIDAGRLVGIGNGRSIGMGRFEIVEFAVSDS